MVADPGADPVTGFRAGLAGVQVDAFVFQRPPEPLYHPVVDPAAASVHRDLHLGLVQHVGEIGAGELRAPIRIENLWLPISGQGSGSGRVKVQWQVSGCALVMSDSFRLHPSF